MSLRPSLRTRRGRRALAAGAFALSVALVPGTAWAEEDPPAAPGPPEAVTDVLDGTEAGELPQEEGEPAEEAPEPPPFEIPPEVVAALQQFAAQAGFSEDCVNGVVASLEQIGNGIAGLPTELQDLLTDLGTAVQAQIADPQGSALQDFLSGLAPAEGAEGPPAPPVGADIVAGLENLAAALQACQPAPPAEEPPAEEPPPAEHPQQPPTVQQPPQQPAAPAPAQPVVYPGYAPTGAEAADGGPSPAAIAVLLAVVAGTAAWAGRRGAARAD